MSMYDYLNDSKLTCPFCGKPVKHIQTYDGPSTGETYHIRYPKTPEIMGKLFPEQYLIPSKLEKLRYIEATATCYSPNCMAIAHMAQLMRYGYVSSSGRTFDVHYPLSKSDYAAIGPGEVTTRNADNDTFEECWNKFDAFLNKRENSRFKTALMKFANSHFAGHVILAILEIKGMPNEALTWLRHIQQGSAKSSGIKRPVPTSKSKSKSKPKSKSRAKSKRRR